MEVDGPKGTMPCEDVDMACQEDQPFDHDDCCKAIGCEPSEEAPCKSPPSPSKGSPSKPQAATQQSSSPSMEPAAAAAAAGPDAFMSEAAVTPAAAAAGPYPPGTETSKTGLTDSYVQLTMSAETPSTLTKLPARHAASNPLHPKSAITTSSPPPAPTVFRPAAAAITAAGGTNSCASPLPKSSTVPAAASLQGAISLQTGCHTFIGKAAAATTAAAAVVEEHVLKPAPAALQAVQEAGMAKKSPDHRKPLQRLMPLL